MNGGFLLDTNVISEFNRVGKPDERVRQWLDAASADALYVSVITLAEIQFGIEVLPPGKRRVHLEQWMDQEFDSWFADRLLPVDTDVVETVGGTIGRSAEPRAANCSVRRPDCRDRVKTRAHAGYAKCEGFLRHRR